MFKAPFSFTGRIRRTELGLTIIISTFIYFLIFILLWFALGQSNDDTAAVSFAIFFIIFILPLFWFQLAQNAKRCHDIGNSGWYQLIPFYGFWLLFAEGEKGPNRYGDDPKGVSVNLSAQHEYSSESKRNDHSNPNLNTAYVTERFAGKNNNESNSAQKPNSNSLVEQLEKIQKMRHEGSITEEEYGRMKNKIIASFD